MAVMDQIVQIAKSELESLLIKATRIGVSQATRVSPILTKAQVAAYLDKSIPTINRYMKEGMPYRKVDGGYPEFSKSQVDRWVDERFKEDR